MIALKDRAFNRVLGDQVIHDIGICRRQQLIGFPAIERPAGRPPLSLQRARQAVAGEQQRVSFTSTVCPGPQAPTTHNLLPDYRVPLERRALVSRPAPSRQRALVHAHR